jgi:hypothetical protein
MKDENMRYLGVVCACVMVFCGCMPHFSDHKMMTFPRYQEVQPGQSVDELIAKFGKPYEKRVSERGSVEYVYIETILVGRNKTLTREYIVQVENGRIISKKMIETQPSVFEFTGD